ncbi:FRG domain-containing protein [Vibrio cholerae]|uniref:FRG domain-containing protein n=2 Tax=Gammaproteobacteria TaxID=1236 RepID=A0ABS7VF13_9GAMM|nr:MULTISPECIES: FRG domain-containing protein [Gammaproteobacteria]EHJ9962113.1 FRG domain-containing protein [Vibrio parahaemolyticus]EHK0040519.1 FRG domain-containing protein [Vibrio parahaemolyticus]EKA7356539.1 FRG domain-containing protein [Vibrio vulnificus]ELG4788338.1 FRG domain-containing protein [Vibrio vulnificus]MBZ6067969.1 FRG domain-containing protein [Aeromonas schubertii]
MDIEQKEFWAQVDEICYKASMLGSNMLFRGMANNAYELIPSIARGTNEGLGGDIESLERSMLSEFKRLTLPILTTEPTNDFEWLFLAQHYGLPTRLLDWTTNPMVALFFAVESEDDNDACLHIVKHMVTDDYSDYDYKTADISEEAKKNSYVLRVFKLQPEQGEVIFIRPKYTDSRYVNQKSIFSCPKNPFEPLKLDNHDVLEIKSKWKPFIRDRLKMMGISHSYIYPGLEGVAKEVRKHMYEPVQMGRHKIISSKVSM